MLKALSPSCHTVQECRVISAPTNSQHVAHAIESSPRVDFEATQSTLERPSKRRQIFYGFFFKIRGLWAVLLLFVMFFVQYGEKGTYLAAWAFGFPLFVIAVGLRVQSQRYLRYRLRGDGGLATDGPYRYMRNPVYVGNSLGLAALCIMCRLYWLAPLAAAWAAIGYDLSVRFEEMRLTKRYGQPYRRYCELVPRWIPRGKPLACEAHDKTSIGRALSVEWQNVLLLLVPLGKYWVFGPHAGTMHSDLTAAARAAIEHKWLVGVCIACGILVLAAWNLRELRSNRHKTAMRQADANS